ncbi:MAG: CPBP family intramembrane glutamate endopeptidase, partial [Cellulosimicrobium funkei]
MTAAALSPLPDAARPPWAVGSPLRLLAAVLVSGSAVLLFAVHARPLGYVPLVLGVALGLLVDRRLGRDLALVGVGMGIISTISLKADLSDAGMVRFAVVLSLAVLVPWALSRFVFREDAVTFPVATGRRWTRGQVVYLVVVVVAGYLILPFYFIGSGAYLNWPPITGGAEIARLFVGVNAV